MARAGNGLQTGILWRAHQTSGAQKAVEELLGPLDIRIDGNRAWDIRVHHPDFYRRVLAGGSLSLGESCMDGSFRSRRNQLWQIVFSKEGLRGACLSPGGLTGRG